MSKVINTIPCSRSVDVKMDTLSKTRNSKNHTLSSGSSPYSPYMGVPPRDIHTHRQTNKHTRAHTQTNTNTRKFSHQGWGCRFFCFCFVTYTLCIEGVRIELLEDCTWTKGSNQGNPPPPPREEWTQRQEVKITQDWLPVCIRSSMLPNLCEESSLISFSHRYHQCKANSKST